jgi:hypothetical protein
MRTGTPASYAVCQASSLLILSILASYAVCQTARPAAIATPPSRLFDPIGFDDEWARHIKATVTIYARTCSCVDISSQLRRVFWEALAAVVHKTIEKVRIAGVTIRHHRDN